MQTHPAEADLLVSKAIDVVYDVFVSDHPSQQKLYGHVKEHGCIQIAYLRAQAPLIDQAEKMARQFKSIYLSDYYFEEFLLIGLKESIQFPLYQI